MNCFFKAQQVPQQIGPPGQLHPPLALLVLHRPHPPHLHHRVRQGPSVAPKRRFKERDRALVELLRRVLELVVGRVQIDAERLGVLGGRDARARHFARGERAPAVELGHSAGNDPFLGQRQPVARPREGVAHGDQALARLARLILAIRRKLSHLSHPSGYCPANILRDI